MVNFLPRHRRIRFTWGCGLYHRARFDPIRQQLTFFEQSSAQKRDHSPAAVEFVTATGAWGTVTHVGIFDAASSGNLIAWAALTTSKAVTSGDVFRFNAGELDVTLA